MHIFISIGPLTLPERTFIEEMAKALKGAGFSVVYPGYVNDWTLNRDLALIRISEIKASDILLPFLDNIEINPVVAWDVGFARANQKTIIGIGTDHRYNRGKLIDYISPQIFYSLDHYIFDVHDPINKLLESLKLAYF